MSEREPMGVNIALSGPQLEHAGVPDWMTEDQLAECVDRALLEDDSALRREIEVMIDERTLYLDEFGGKTETFITYSISEETRAQLIDLLEGAYGDESQETAERILPHIKGAPAEVHSVEVIG